MDGEGSLVVSTHKEWVEELWEGQVALGGLVDLWLDADKPIHVELADKRGELCVLEKLGKPLLRKPLPVGHHKRRSIL